MEILYHVFTGLFQAAGILLLMPVVLLLMFALVKDLSVTGLVAGVGYFLLLYTSIRLTLAGDKKTEPERPSRFQSSLVWLAVVLLVPAVLNAVCSFGSLSGGVDIYPFGVHFIYLVSAPLFPIAAAAVVFRPFKHHKGGLIYSILGIFVALLWAGAVAIFAPRHYTYTGRRLPLGYEMPREMRKAFFPDGARDFKIEGGSFFIGYHAEWTCTVSEKDFERFRQVRGYHFVLDRTDVNEDKNISPWNYDDSRWPKPYYFHNDRHANGGGLTLRYSVPERKLYGSCSSH